MSSPDETFHFEIDGRVARFTLRRPERLNALNDDLRIGLRDCLTELEDRPDVGILVIRGDGRAFSAGADLTGTAYPPIVGDWATRRHLTGHWQRVIDQLGRIPQVTVAGVHGHVIGGGALLAGICDLRIADEATVLRIPEVLIGMPLAWAGFPILAREVGLPHARDWIMTGRSVPADELLRTGFVTRLAPAGGLDEALDELVAELLAVPPGPLAISRGQSIAAGRADPSVAIGWADPDLQQWTFTEDEYRATARRYLERGG